MKFKIIILFLNLILGLTTAADNAYAQSADQTTELRQCYEDALYQSGEDSDDPPPTIMDIVNPDSFFSDCDVVDHEIIKQMYIQEFNSDKLMFTAGPYWDYDKYKQHIVDSINNLKIDFKPDDINNLSQWEPFSIAYNNMQSEYYNRDQNKGASNSNNYISGLYSIENQFNKLDDLTLATYIYNYLDRIYEKHCSVDCEAVYNFFQKTLDTRPNVKRILLEKSDATSRTFMHDNIQFGFRSAELNRSLRNDQNRVNKEISSKSTAIHSDSDPIKICNQIKKIRTENKCGTPLSIINRLRVTDHDADELWKDKDHCQNILTIRTIHAITKIRGIKKDKTNLIIQVYSPGDDYIFNEKWTLQNFTALTNTCRAL